MKNSIFVIRSYLKKSKLQISVITLMIIIASMILGVALILFTDYKENFFNSHDSLHAEHVVMDYASLTPNGENFIREKLSGDSDVSSFEITPAAFVKGNCQYGDDGLLTSIFVAMKMSDAENKEIGQFEILDEGTTGDGYIPYIFKANGFYETGDTFTVNLGGTEKSFVIKGFYNNLTTGTVNCRDVVLLLSDEKYAEIVGAGLTPGYRLSIRLNEPEEAATLEADILDKLSDDTSGITYIASTNYIKLSSVRYISETVFTGVLCAAVAVIVIVLLAIVAVSLSNFIKENIRNLGIMKAVGYESANLCLPIILLLTFLSLVSSCIGYALSYALLPTINQILESQSGIPYSIHLLILPGVITMGMMVVLVFYTVVLSLSKMKTILPIMAIRPVKARQNSINVLPLKKAKTGLHFTLGMKNIFSEPKKYLVFFITSFLVTIMLCVSAYCVDNILNHPENVIRMVMGNTADVSLTVSQEKESTLKDWLSSSEDVTDSYVYTHSSVCHEGGDRIDVEIRDEEGNKLSEYLLIKGSLPQNDTEVAVNFAYASSMDLEIGDEIVLKNGANKQTYSICGLFQDALSSGKNISMLRSGYEKLEQLTTITYLIDLHEDTDIDAFISDMCLAVPVSALNYSDFVNGVSATYVSMLNALIILITIVSILIATMVLSVIVNMILFNKRRTHGIMKSLGFVTSEIVFQTAVSFVPVAIFGSMLGLLVSYRGVSLLFSSFVKSIGIYSFGDSIGMVYLLSCGILFTLLTFVLTWFLSMKVKNIVPHDLFNNE